jgi:hypothetical protein
MEVNIGFDVTKSSCGRLRVFEFKTNILLCRHLVGVGKLILRQGTYYTRYMYCKELGVVEVELNKFTIDKLLFYF